MISDRCIKELYKVVNIEGLDRKFGTEARVKALEEWIRDWIVDMEYSQSILKKNLTMDDMDFIKYHCAKEIGERIMDDCVKLDIDKNEVKLRLLALKR